MSSILTAGSDNHWRKSDTAADRSHEPVATVPGGWQGRMIQPAVRSSEVPMPGYPVLLHTAIDARDCRGLAEFYRQLLGLRYRPGDEPPADGAADDTGWLVLVDEAGDRVLAIQQKAELTPSTWPSEEVPMQLHMDFRVPTLDELTVHRRRAEDLGARLLYDRSADQGEPLYVMADPAGHPFCLLVQ
jgi:catechol 2,3-dioxygenase-like lactoylglutathione lyase family enzyme